MGKESRGIHLREIKNLMLGKVGGVPPIQEESPSHVNGFLEMRKRKQDLFWCLGGGGCGLELWGRVSQIRKT